MFRQFIDITNYTCFTLTIFYKVSIENKWVCPNFLEHTLMIFFLSLSKELPNVWMVFICVLLVFFASKFGLTTTKIPKVHGTVWYDGGYLSWGGIELGTTLGSSTDKEKDNVVLGKLSLE